MKEKRYYEQPEIEIVQLLTEDILAASTEGEDTDVDAGDLFG